MQLVRMSIQLAVDSLHGHLAVATQLAVVHLHIDFHVYRWLMRFHYVQVHSRQYFRYFLLQVFCGWQQSPKLVTQMVCHCVHLAIISGLIQ